MKAERLLAAVLRLLPENRRELGRALLAEMSTLPQGRQRRAWLTGGMWFVLRENSGRMAAYGTGVAIAVTALVAVDRLGTSDDSSQVSLLVLLAGATALGFAAPRQAWLSALLLGSTLAVSGLLVPAHQPVHGGPGTLFVLIAPAMAGAYLGAGAAWLRRRGL